MKQTANVTGHRHVKRTLGRFSVETWTTPDAYPMFWIYTRPPQHAVQITIWRHKWEIRWRQPR